VLCLYCETELNTLRGFFDEDFCCREHREKYFSSFRKALTGFGVSERIATALAVSQADDEMPAPAAAPDPRVSGFLPVTVPSSIAGLPATGALPEALTVRGSVEIPDPETAWTAVLEFEERPADLAVPAEITMAALEPAPPSLGVSAAQAVSVASALELSFQGTPQATALNLPLADDFAECTLFCQDLAGKPVGAGEMALSQQTAIPAFTPVCDLMQSEDEHESTSDPTEPYWGELYTEPAPDVPEFSSAFAMAPEIVPAMLLSAASQGRPVLVPASSSHLMPQGLEITSARSVNVPASTPPAVAPEVATTIADGDAADSAAGPRSHEPMRLSFGNLVRIKNWRLRITFAKPA
jgi:hypothetical protein